MSIWIRVVNRSSLSDVTPEALRAGIVDRLPRLAANYGEEGAQAATEHVTVVHRPKAGGASGEFDVFELRWAPDQKRPVRIERWVEKQLTKRPANLEGDYYTGYRGADGGPGSGGGP